MQATRSDVVAPQMGTPQLIAVTPWPSIRRQVRAILIGVATCLAVLVTIELAVFRSGYFATHVAISNPQTAAAKLALAERHADSRVLYVGDSTIMTSVMPTVVSATCACGTGFNGGFSAANPWLTRAMTERLLGFMHPKVVVISVSPWAVDAHATFADDGFAHDLLSPAELESLGAPVDLQERVDAAVGTIWSAYGQRELLTEWFTALTPGQRYDESLLGYWVAPGSANSYSRVVAAADRLFTDVVDAATTAPGATVLTSLVSELKARGIRVVFLVPPLHPASYELAGPFLRAADVAIRDLATRQDVPIVDCRSVVSADDFRDATHVFPGAAQRHSQCVGEQLRALALD